MIKIQEIIKETIAKSLKGTDVADVDFNIEHPTDLSHGDYSTNVAMVAAKTLGANPRQTADLLVEKMQKKLPAEIAEISVAGPGFINFRLSGEFFHKNLKEILAAEQEYGKSKRLRKEKVVIEYTDPNPFKQFHIGHLMSNSIGECFARLATWNGAKVTRMTYGGDVGPHVAQTLWGILQNEKNFPTEDAPLAVKTKFLGEAYVFGNQKYETDENAKAEVKEINKQVYGFASNGEKWDSELERYYELGKKWSLQHFEEIYEKLGSKFDQYVFESATAALGTKLVKENIGKIFEESQGAVVYKGEQDGLHTRVFLNHQGLPTYEAKDLGLAFYKQRTGKYDRSIVITASEQDQYFQVMLAALSKLDAKVAANTTHISHGMMQFADGKMSSRKGNVITGESLLLDLEAEVAEKMKERDFSSTEAAQLTTDIAVAALKYSILKQAPGKNIIFDREKAMSFEGDSGPYLQYTYTRAKSVIEKAAAHKKSDSVKKVPANWQTTTLEKLLYRFPEVIEKSYDEFGPQILVTYATQLASEFNSYYGREQILDGSADESYKLAVVRATMIVLANAIRVLGMRPVGRM